MGHQLTMLGKAGHLNGSRFHAVGQFQRPASTPQRFIHRRSICCWVSQQSKIPILVGARGPTGTSPRASLRHDWRSLAGRRYVDDSAGSPE